MDLDTIITLVFLAVFFILPSIFKTIVRVGQKKKPVAKEKKPSVFDKIREQIQAFVRELEKQARRQKQMEEGEEEKSFWEGLAEEHSEEKAEKAEPPPVPHGLDPEYLAALKEVDVAEIAPEKTVVRPQRVPAAPARKSCRFRSNPLQNAVVWSEILGKPVALRDE